MCSDFTFLYTVHVCHILSFVISFTLSCIFYMYSNIFIFTTQMWYKFLFSIVLSMKYLKMQVY